jgi:hypothetical protein
MRPHLPSGILDYSESPKMPRLDSQTPFLGMGEDFQYSFKSGASGPPGISARVDMNRGSDFERTARLVAMAVLLSPSVRFHLNFGGEMLFNCSNITDTKCFEQRDVPCISVFYENPPYDIKDPCCNLRM